MNPGRNRGLYHALAGITLLMAAAFVSNRPVMPRDADASPSVFSAGRTQAILQDLVGNGTPHPIGSRDGARIRDIIVKRLSALGYTTELQTGFVCNDAGVCGSPVNVLAKIGPDSGRAEAVLLAAHYDSVAAGPGASDDGVGVATVLEIARILASLPPPRHPIILLLNEGEEAGLLGALLFVREHALVTDVKAAVNLDARGTSGASLMFETGSANSWAMRLYESAIGRPATNSLYYVGYQFLPNSTDFTVFKAAGYQGFNFAFVGNVGRYHTPRDTWANASPSSIQAQGDNALATLLALANADTLHPPVDNSVFFSVFARWLVIWSAHLSLPAAIAALIVLWAYAVMLLRKKVATGREVLWGAFGTAGVLLLGVALSAGITVLLISFGKVPPRDGASWISHPLPMNVAAAAIAFLAAASAGAWLTRRAGFWGFWIAATLTMAGLAVASSAFVPGMSFLVLLPGVAAAFAVLPCIWSYANARAPSAGVIDCAAIFPALVVFALVLPLLPFAYEALGSVGWPLITLFVCLGTVMLLPLIAHASRRTRKRILVLSVMVAVGGALSTLLLPTYSPEWPERINFEYWLDADTGQAHWRAQTDSLRLPAHIARAANFDSVRRPRFSGSASLGFHAAAPHYALAPPELKVLVQPATGLPWPAASPLPSLSVTTRYDLHLYSPRGAPEAVVIFPASSNVKEITLQTKIGPVRAKLHPMKSGAMLLDIVGLPFTGVEFSINAAGSPPLAVQVFDQSYGLAAGRFLQQARPLQATSSQDGDLTVVHRTVSLAPAPGP